MLKQYKGKLIASSALILLPILAGLLLWNKFPEKMITHWGITGQPDGWSSVPFAVFAPPLILLALHWLCLWFTVRDPGNQGRNKKPIGMVLWIIPFLSNLCSGIMYALALGTDVSVSSIMLVAMGLIFVVIGNYLPKCKMNATMGIKVPWTYTSEENWNATHRFGGKVWVVGGIVMALGALLPAEWGETVMLAAMVILVALPTIYSWRYYCQQKANGEPLTAVPAKGKPGKGSIAALAVLLVLILTVLFVGEIGFEFREDYLFIDADFYNDYLVYYDAIDAVEYREGNVEGLCVGGYGSLRLLMGYFENDEFGIYTRYTYYNPDACVVVTTSDKTLVLSAENAAKTRTLYETLLSKTS